MNREDYEQFEQVTMREPVSIAAAVIRDAVTLGADPDRAEAMLRGEDTWLTNYEAEAICDTVQREIASEVGGAHSAPTDPGLTIHTDDGDFVSLAWLRSKGLLR